MAAFGLLVITAPIGAVGWFIDHLDKKTSDVPTPLGQGQEAQQDAIKKQQDDLRRQQEELEKQLIVEVPVVPESQPVVSDEEQPA